MSKPKSGSSALKLLRIVPPVIVQAFTALMYAVPSFEKQGNGA